MDCLKTKIDVVILFRDKWFWNYFEIIVIMTIQVQILQMLKQFYIKIIV